MPPNVPTNIKHQINELIRLNAGARPISSDPPVYEVPINTIYGRLTLHVAFPDASLNQSITQAPTVQVASLVDHQWLDDDMYFTNYHSINQWNSQSNIGLIVREIVTEWTAAPPMPLQASKQSSNQPKIQPKNQSVNQSVNQSNHSHDEWVMVNNDPQNQANNQSNVQSNNQSNNASSVSNVQSNVQSVSQSNNQSVNQSSNQSSALMLPIPQSFDWIENMSLAELERIYNENNQSANQVSNLSNNQSIKDSIYQSEAVQHIEQVKSGLFDSVDRLCLSNIDQSEQYNQLVERLKDARNQSINQSIKQQQLIDRQKALLQKYSPQGLIALLDQAINQSEAKSLAIQNAYLNGDQEDQSINQAINQSGNRRNADTHSRFIEAYVKERALQHLRQAKRERTLATMD